MSNLRSRLARLEQRAAATASVTNGPGSSGMMHPADTPDLYEPAWTPAGGWSHPFIAAMALKFGITEERLAATMDDAMQRLRDAGLAEPE